MTKEEQLAAIKDGKSVLTTTDDNIEVQQTPIEKEKTEEKAAAPVEEESKEVTAEVPKEEPEVTTTSEASSEFEPDVKLGVDVPSIEVPVDPVPTSSSEIDVTPAPEVPFTINVDDINVGNNAETTTSEVTAPAYEQPVQNNDFSFGGLSNDASLNNFSGMSNAAENTTSSSELFSSAYDSVANDTKTIAAVVTEQDQVHAKSAFMNASEKIYDAGPGKQISILRNFSAEAAKWIRSADKMGFVSGEMHDIAKNILREYEGLQAEQDEFTDDNKIIPFQSNYNEQPVNQFDNFSGMNNGKIIQYPQNNNDMGSNGNSLAAS